MNTTTELLASIDLEVIDKNIFRGHSHDVGSPNVFGGQVLSQSLHAAMLTVPQERTVHSLHSYFILPGNLEIPIIFDVDHIRDGGSFTTRRVRAIQNGKVIFILSASFQEEQEGLDHQIDMKKIKGPEELISDQALLEQFKDQLPENIRKFRRPRPVEFRPLNPMAFIAPQKMEPRRYVWFKALGEVPNNERTHKRIVAYASDYNLLSTAILPHQHEVRINDLQLASLDHAMWFHRPVKVDDWLLFEIESPSASNSRGLARGSVFTKDGILVATVIQEGLMRIKRKK
ncbi:UNVERIFIED_CONTAM: hypothetical protein GTU68_027383 [Idotea baltica]|nr:hypothetical protein [Idotea baltica]